jgi:glucokinase
MPEHVPSVDVANAQRPLFAGVDVGGTTIKLGIVDAAGSTVAFTRIDTNATVHVEDTLRRLAEALGELLADHGLAMDDLAAIGLGTPGTMDIPAGLILEPPNLPGWRHYPVRDELHRLCGETPVAFANDGAAAAYGEYWIGTGRQHDSMVMLTLGTGVGGGIIVDGVAIDGAHSHGSECGHIIVDASDEARPCSCGQPGHLESYASAKAVVGRTEEALEAGAESSLQDLRAQGQKVTALAIYQAAENGDPLARTIISETAGWLAIGIVTLLHTIDPALVVLGGAMDFGGHKSALGREFLETIRQQVCERTFPVIAEQVTIDFASLGADAGYIGAAGLGRELVKEV